MKPSPELIQLVDKTLASEISQLEMNRLEELLSDDDALRYYLETVGVEADLPAALGADTADLFRSRVTRSSFSRWIKPLTLAAAAAVLFSIGYFTGHKSDSSYQTIAETTPAQKSSTYEAQITSLIGVSWNGEAPASIKIDEHSKPIAFKSGLVELTFASGVRSLIEGPAVIQVTGENSAQLDYGRMVADVPKGAEGFTVIYPEGKVVDLGTEFGINVPLNQKGAEVGVFRGEVEVYDKRQNKPLKIRESHAVAQVTEGGESPFASIPFQHKNYIRKLPSREFSWELSKEKSSSPEFLEFDVSHLVWKSGKYRALIKWMKGGDALIINGAEILCDGKVIVQDLHKGRTGLKTHDNTYSFSIPQGSYKRGRWTLRVSSQAADRNDVKLGTFTPESSGILLFDDHGFGFPESAFLGTWEYSHNGDIYQRIFTEDHRARCLLNGEEFTSFIGATWRIQDEILILNIPGANLTERHILRNKNEMIFMGLPYRNAIKIP